MDEVPLAMCGGKLKEGASPIADAAHGTSPGVDDMLVSDTS